MYATQKKMDMSGISLNSMTLNQKESYFKGQKQVLGE